MPSSRFNLVKCAIVLTLSVHILGIEGTVYNVERERGEQYTATHITAGKTVTECYIISPSNVRTEFYPEDQSNEKIKLLESNFLSECAVTINNLEVSDNGVWTLTFVDEEDNSVTNSYNITIASEDYIHEIEGSFYNVNVDSGDFYTATHITAGKRVAQCYIISPNDVRTEFRPVDESNDKLKLQEPSFLSECTVMINNLDQSDNGIWKFTFIDTESISITNSYNITVTAAEIPNFKEDENITWLSEIKHFTRIGDFIDITLDKRFEPEETCYVLDQNSNLIRDLDVDIEGVKIQESSKFVSCRITIGPIVESLLGRWSLCGKRMEEEIEYERCQPIEITKPTNSWTPEIIPTFDHPVNYGGQVNPAVRGTGDIVTCHAVTPNGEDLVITEESKYLGITRMSINDNELCSIVISPIESSHLGSWTIYGKFFSTIMGVTEIQQHITMNLFNISNPYQQAYNVSQLDSALHIINLGSTVNVDITYDGVTESCELMSPFGEVYSNSLENIMFKNTGEGASCEVALGPINENMLGEWQIIAKFNNSGLFTEKRRAFYLIQEDPENPLDTTEREIIYEGEKYFNTEIGASHTISLTVQTFTNHKASCHIRTPNNLQYTIMEGFNVPGVEVIEASNSACIIKVDVISEDSIGDWMFISRTDTEPIEKRMNFTIYVREYVEASPKKAVIAEGNDFYLRLENPTDLHDTCSLFDPSGKERAAIKDVRYVDTCGFVVNSVSANDRGDWEIRYGNKIDYRAPVALTVTGRSFEKEGNFIWIKDRPVNEVYGPEDTVYCKVEDPHGYVVFDGFGRCIITLENVNLAHIGIWKIFINLPGHVVTEEHQVTVDVVEAESKALVSTYVTKESPTVVLSCSVSTPYQVRACKFRNPSGQILLATQGIGEDRYDFHGVGEVFESEVDSHDCGLRITNPITSDLGIWRCAIETEQETYYGFLTVLCPWAMADPEVADTVIADPTLTVDRNYLVGVEDDTIAVSCSIQAPIRYCYFRAPNGTMYSVGPGNSHDNIEYVGHGFDAGECGGRFRFNVKDSGTWSCHVGLSDVMQPEQRARYNVTIREAIMVAQYKMNNVLMVEGQVYDERDLEYCRFVRIDGLGFTDDNMPDGYRSGSTLSSGHCLLIVEKHSLVDDYPWTVVAKIRGQDVEISKFSAAFTDRPITVVYYGYYRVWALILFLLGISMIAAGLLVPPKTRKWTYTQASSIRRSFRKSFQRKAAPQTAGESTPVAA